MKAYIIRGGGPAVIFDGDKPAWTLEVKNDGPCLQNAQGLHVSMYLDNPFRKSGEGEYDHLEYREDAGEYPFTELYEYLQAEDAYATALSLINMIVEHDTDEEIRAEAVAELEDFLDQNESTYQRLLKQCQDKRSTNDSFTGLATAINQIDSPKVRILLDVYPGVVPESGQGTPV